VTEPGHPIHTFMAENRELEQRLSAWDALMATQDLAAAEPAILALLDDLAKVEIHYQRKENQLFPWLEKKHFNGPSTVMWGVHGEARKVLALVRNALGLADPILRHLPLDASFVDENDRVAWYPDTPHRIFPRSPAVIGRVVQNCHPPKSVHAVESILAAFRDGRQSKARFWFNLGGKLLLIEYFAVRDAAGAYRGSLEVFQDITGIQALEGERRLLAWEG
jgi:DUF438 domain-containing protein